jgi:putative peptidoglycan lipid II flippase
MIKVREPASVRSDTAPVRTSQASLVTNSMTGSIWTLVSRMTGLARILVLGAVLGATYLGNTYQGMNALPNLVYYQILAGSLFVSLLVPPLMRHLREGDQERADTLVRGFFGGVLALGVIAMAAIMVAAPLILHVFSLGVTDPHSAADQRRVGLVLLLLFAPQIPLYVIAGTGAAVMNAYGRYALAAGAPTIENVGIMVTLVAVAVVYGTGGTLSNVSTSEIVILGLGTTGAVALHAALEWLGARRSQPSMRPALARNDPEVRTVLVRIRAVLAYTGLATLQLVVTMVIANRVAGGLVAFQLALNFFYLPTAIITWPVARALVPRLAVFHQTGNAVAFREELGKALGLACFVTVPIAAAYAASAHQIAHIVAFGRLDTANAIGYVAVSLIALSPAVIGETAFILGTYALYAQEDVRAPVRSMLVRVATTVILMIPATQAHGSQVLLLIGAAFSAGSFVGALHAWHQVDSRTPAGRTRPMRMLARTGLASIVMVAVGALAWKLTGELGASRPAEVVRLGLAAAAGGTAYLGFQAWLHAPEMRLLRESGRLPVIGGRSVG